MRDDEMIEQLRDTLRRWNEKPQELWDELLRRGVIDADGNVLVRMPEPPERLDTDGKQQTQKDSSASPNRDRRSTRES